jgi:hypothetical protein
VDIYWKLSNEVAMSPGGTSLGEALVAVIAVATLPVGILTALFVGLVPAAVVFVVGWLFLVPVVAILQDALGEPGPVEEAVSTAMTDAVSEAASEATSGRSPSGNSEDPLETLRARYAAGEIDEVEFERKVERLLETEDVDVPEGASLGEDERGAVSTADRADDRRDRDRR